MCCENFVIVNNPHGHSTPITTPSVLLSSHALVDGLWGTYSIATAGAPVQKDEASAALLMTHPALLITMPPSSNTPLSVLDSRSGCQCPKGASLLS